MLRRFIIGLAVWLLPLPALSASPYTLESAPAPPGQTVLKQTVVVVDPDQPMAVWIVAMASSEVTWNGVVIGRNGVPASTREAETPGRYQTVFPVPFDLVKPGPNQVTARFSSHHLWLPVGHPLHQFAALPLAQASRPGTPYIPALLAAGGLAAAAMGFGLIWLNDRSQRGARLMSLLALAAVTQLGVEAAPAVLNYDYPWHLARLVVIALLAAISGVLIARYAAWRFAPDRTRLVTALAAGVAALILLLVPAYDGKAAWCLMVGAGAVIVCAAPRVLARRPSAIGAVVLAVTASALMTIQGGGFLDSGHYLVLAVLFAALMVEQIRLMRGRAEPSPPTSETITARDDVIVIRAGRRTHLLAVADVAFLKAADDYCEAHLTNGRSLLHGEGLSAVLEQFPVFVRVHRGYAVNPSQVTGAATRPGGGRQLALGPAGLIPVGRTYRPVVAALLGEDAGAQGPGRLLESIRTLPNLP